MKAKTALSLVVAVVGPLAVGCSGSSAPTESIDLTNASLRRAQSCSDLTAALRDDARSKMNRRVDAEVRAIREGYSYYGYGGEGDFGGAPMAGAASPATQNGASGAAPAPSHSNTETQVEGVDEADIVKADGTRLYVLHGQKFLMVDAWPAPSLATAGSIDIEGEPSEMFVASGKAVVFSTVDGAPVYAAAGITPRPAYDDSYGGPGGYYGGGGGVGFAGTPAVSGGTGGGYAIGAANPLTKVTVLALDGATARVTRELYFEGSYLSSRRVGTKVRIVLEGGAHGPALDYDPVLPSTSSGPTMPALAAQPAADQIAMWEALRAKNEAAIAATTYADWVPSGFTKDDAGLRSTPGACGDFYVPTAGTTESGMTQIEAIDLDAPADPPRSATIVGAVETVYGDTSSMVLAGRAYVDPWTLRQTFGGLPSGVSKVVQPVTTMSYTHLHLFDLSIDPSQPLYVASGTVPGDVKDQFSLDQKDGRVRVTTTEQRSGPARTDGKQNQVSHVFVLENDSGRLALKGDAGEIAPGEQLYATRYVGDKAYVVTWHVTDPLFVIDLADPAHPTVLGQLQIPGFSEYMHPLDATHLLTIGRETDMTGHQHTTGGYWYGLAIQIFDVTDPLSPKLQQKYVYDGGDYATSEATQDHKAFTYFDDRKLLAFPYVRQSGYGATATSGPSSTLEVFHVDAVDGIQKLGSVDHSSMLGTLPSGRYGYCGGYFDGAVRRGVFFENVVYSISYGGILANDVSQLATPISSLHLAAPTMQGLTCQ